LPRHAAPSKWRAPLAEEFLADRRSKLQVVADDVTFLKAPRSGVEEQSERKPAVSRPGLRTPGRDKRLLSGPPADVGPEKPLRINGSMPKHGARLKLRYPVHEYQEDSHGEAGRSVGRYAQPPMP
jgi:hypothetical protein